MLGLVSYSFPFWVTLAGPKVELHPVGRNDSLASWWTRELDSAAWHLVSPIHLTHWGNFWGDL